MTFIWLILGWTDSLNSAWNPCSYPQETLLGLIESGRGLQVWSATPYSISLGRGFITLIPLTEGECVLNI